MGVIFGAMKIVLLYAAYSVLSSKLWPIDCGDTRDR
jgi:hypothetical protein